MRHKKSRKFVIFIILDWLQPFLKSRIFLVCAFFIFAYCGYVISKNATLFWYPHSRLDIYLNLLFGLVVLIETAIIHNLISMSKETCFVFVVFNCIVDIFSYIAKILVMAVIIHQCSRPWMLGYTMFSWGLGLALAVLFLYEYNKSMSGGIRKRSNKHKH